MQILTVNGVSQMYQRSYIENMQHIQMQPVCALLRDSPQIWDWQIRIGQILWVAKHNNSGVMFDSLLANQEDQTGDIAAETLAMSDWIDNALF